MREREEETQEYYRKTQERKKQKQTKLDQILLSSTDEEKVIIGMMIDTTKKINTRGIRNVYERAEASLDIYLKLKSLPQNVEESLIRNEIIKIRYNACFLRVLCHFDSLAAAKQYLETDINYTLFRSLDNFQKRDDAQTLLEAINEHIKTEKKSHPAASVGGGGGGGGARADEEAEQPTTVSSSNPITAGTPKDTVDSQLKTTVASP